MLVREISWFFTPYKWTSISNKSFWTLLLEGPPVLRLARFLPSLTANGLRKPRCRKEEGGAHERIHFPKTSCPLPKILSQLWDKMTARPEALKAFCICLWSWMSSLFSLLVLLVNKKWLCSMKVKKTKNFQNKMGWMG